MSVEVFIQGTVNLSLLLKFKYRFHSVTYWYTLDIEELSRLLSFSILQGVEVSCTQDRPEWPLEIRSEAWAILPLTLSYSLDALAMRD